MEFQKRTWWLLALLIILIIAILYLNYSKELECSIKLLSPSDTNGVSREVEAQFKISSKEILNKIKRKEYRCYLFQHNTLESHNQWHFAGYIQYPNFKNKLWLGSDTHGIGEDFIIRFIISNEKINFKTGSGVDVVTDTDMPNIVCEDSFLLHRVR